MTLRKNVHIKKNRCAQNLKYTEVIVPSRFQTLFYKHNFNVSRLDIIRKYNNLVARQLF